MVHKPIIANLPLIVVPLEKGTNPDAVAAQLEAAEIIHIGSHETATTQPASEQERQLLSQAERARTFRARRIGNVVVYASELTLDQLSKGEPTTKSASAAKALANASKSSAGVQVSLLPDAVHFMRDMLQEEDNKSQDPLDKAILKLEWVSLDVQVGKQPSASLKLYCQPGSEKLVKEAFEEGLKSVGADSKWAAVAKSLHVIARDKRVELQLTGQDLGRLLMLEFNEPASTQPTAAPVTQRAPR